MRRLNQRVAALAAAMLLPLAAQAPMAQSLRPAAADAARARVIVKYRADSEMTEEAGDDGHRPAHPAGAGARRPDRRALVAGAGISDRSHVVTAPRPELGQPGGSAQCPGRRRIRGRRRAQAHRRRAQRSVLCQPPRDDDHRRSGGRPVVPEAAGGRTGPAEPTPRRRRSTPSRPGTSTGTSAAPSIVVAVLDTGLRFDHPDLLAATWCPATT